MTTPARNTAWINGLLLAVIVVIAIGVRLPKIGEAGLWNDEAIVAAVAEHPLDVLLDDMRKDAHPPLFFVIAHMVRLAVGFEGWTEGSIRSISLFFGLISIVVIYKVGQQLISERAGILAAFLLAISPMHIHYSREGRNYTLMMLLILLAMSGVAALHRRPELRTAFLTSLVFIALFYTHSIAFFILAPLGLMLIAPLFQRMDRQRIAALGLLAAVALIGLLPWLSTMFSQITNVAMTSVRGSGPVEWVQPHWERLFPFQIPWSLAAMTHGAPPPINNFSIKLAWTAWFALAISLALIFAGWRCRSGWRHPWSAYLLVTAGLGSLILLFLASWLSTPIYTPGRVDTVALPAFILLIASGVAAISRSSGDITSYSPIPSGWRVLVCLVPVVVLTTLAIKPIGNEIEAERGNHNRSWMRYVAKSTSDGDVFLVTGKWWTTLEYYLPRAGRSLHLVGFPSAREQHPNWLDWSTYPAGKLRKDAEVVADKAAGIVMAENSTVWLDRKGLSTGKAELVKALSSRLTTVTFKPSERRLGSSYLAFRATPSMMQAQVAIKKAKRAADLNPQSLELQYRAGRELQSAGQPSQAVPYLERAVGLDPNYRQAEFWLAFAYQKSGLSKNALESYNHFLASNPDHVQGHFNLAYELKGEGNCETAIEHFNKVLQLNPGYRETHLHLSRCYGTLGEARLADRHLKLYGLPKK